MKRFLWLVVGLGVVAQAAVSQTASTMHQIISSDPLLARDSTFRQMQDQIETELGRTGKGAQLNLLFNKMSKVQEDIIAFLQPPMVSADTVERKIVISYGGKKLELQLPKSPPKDVIVEEIRTKLRKELHQAFSKALNNFRNPSTRNSVIRALSKALAGSPLSVGVDQTTLGLNEDPEKLAEVLAEVLTSSLESELQRRLEEIMRLAEPFRLPRLAEEINRLLAEAADLVREPFLRAFQTAETGLRTLVDRFSKTLLAGNAGFALTEGTGAFAGGFIVTFVRPNSKVGLYVNTQFRNATTTDPATQSLLGAQYEWIGCSSQFDVMASYFFGPIVGKSVEIGIAHSNVIFSSVILSKSLFAYKPGRSGFENASVMVGLGVRGLSQNSPGLFLGKRFQKGRSWDMLVQVSFPIIPLAE